MIFTSLLELWTSWDCPMMLLHPINRSEFKYRIACQCGNIKRNLTISTPLNLLYTKTTAASHSTKCNRITWGDIVTVLVPLGVLKRRTVTTFHLLTCIRIISRIIKAETFDRFLEGFIVIEGQLHLNPHQNYRWCDSLAK